MKQESNISGEHAPFQSGNGSIQIYAPQHCLRICDQIYLRQVTPAQEHVDFEPVPLSLQFAPRQSFLPRTSVSLAGRSHGLQFLPATREAGQILSNIIWYLNKSLSHAQHVSPKKTQLHLLSLNYCCRLFQVVNHVFFICFRCKKISDLQRFVRLQ